MVGFCYMGQLALRKEGHVEWAWGDYRNPWKGIAFPEAGDSNPRGISGESHFCFGGFKDGEDLPARKVVICTSWDGSQPATSKSYPGKNRIPTTTRAGKRTPSSRWQYWHHCHLDSGLERTEWSTWSHSGWTSDLHNCEIIHGCCFKPFSLCSSALAEIENSWVVRKAGWFVLSTWEKVASLGLSNLICKMGMIMVPIKEICWED
jgi:hypothetical protein